MMQTILIEIFKKKYQVGKSWQKKTIFVEAKKVANERKN